MQINIILMDPDSNQVDIMLRFLSFENNFEFEWQTNIGVI